MIWAGSVTRFVMHRDRGTSSVTIDHTDRVVLDPANPRRCNPSVMGVRPSADRTAIFC
jgi:hypothetical protein